LSIDEALSRTEGAETRHYLGDALGNTVALADTGGALSTTYTYAPFGETALTGLPFANAVQYTGRENDGTGLYYYRARYYDPTRSRFVSEDPIGFAGRNLYSYVRNGPLRARDPLGLIEWPLDAPMPWNDDPNWLRTMPCPCPPVPSAPPSASCNDNIAQAENRYDPFWFYDQVRNKGPWDYKQQGPQYQDFGNFNYGAAGRAFGWPPPVLQRAAGLAQQQAGTSSPQWGNWWGGSPYGDDPADQLMIQQGMQYYECRCYKR
jgi:RHS repeat-associated protein